MIYVKIGESSNSPNPLDLSANDFGSLETSTSAATRFFDLELWTQINRSNVTIETDAGRVNFLLYQELYKPIEH